MGRCRSQAWGVDKRGLFNNWENGGPGVRGKGRLSSLTKVGDGELRRKKSSMRKTDEGNYSPRKEIFRKEASGGRKSRFLRNRKTTVRGRKERIAKHRHSYEGGRREHEHVERRHLEAYPQNSAQRGGKLNHHEKSSKTNP